MSITIPKELLEAYSRGELTRRELTDRLGEPIGFGPLLGELHRYGMSLPRTPTDPHSPGAVLVRDLAARGRLAG